MKKKYLTVSNESDSINVKQVVFIRKTQVLRKKYGINFMFMV